MAGKQTHQTLLLGENGSVGDQGPRDPSRDRKVAQTCSNPVNPEHIIGEKLGIPELPGGVRGFQRDAITEQRRKSRTQGSGNPVTIPTIDHPGKLPISYHC